MSVSATVLDAEAIGRLLPHRPPLLLVERVTQLELGPQTAIQAELMLAPIHPVLVGHFPGNPVWPGCYTLEGLAQTCALAGLAASREGPAAENSAAPPTVFMAAVKVKLLRPVVPPGVLVYRARHTHRVGEIHRFWVQAVFGNATVAEGTLDVAVAGRAR